MADSPWSSPKKMPCGYAPKPEQSNKELGLSTANLANKYYSLSEAERQRIFALSTRLFQESNYGTNPVYVRVSKPELKEFLQLFGKIQQENSTLWRAISWLTEPEKVEGND